MVPEGDTPRADSIGAYETTDGLRLEGRINGCGVYRYEDEEGNSWGELRLPEHVFAEPVLDGWKISTLTDDHPDEWVTPDNYAALTKGGLGSNVRPDDAKRWTLADIAVKDAGLIAKVKGGKTALSCGYLTKLVEQSGEYEGEPYDFIQTEIEPNHVSVVDEARGPGCEFVIDGVRSIRSRPSQQQKQTGDGADVKTQKIKIPKNGANADGTVMVGEAEVEVPDEVAKLIEDLKAKVMEQGAELAKLQGEGDADPPAADPAAAEKEVPPMAADAKNTPKPAPTPAPNTDAADAKMAFLAAEVERLSGELKASKDGFGQSVSARVALLTTARDILGPTAALDSMPDISIKRAVVAKVSPSMTKAMDGKSADFVEAAYAMALEAHAKTKDSSGALLELTGRASLAPTQQRQAIDLNQAYAKAKDSLRNASTQAGASVPKEN